MKRILLVEDNPANRRLIGDHLRRSGHDVTAVESAVEGIHLTSIIDFDLVVMDIQLPDMDGISATRALRAEERTRVIPILALTALAMRGDRQRILSAGCNGYASKPIEYKEFLRQVDELLGQAGQSQGPVQ